MPPIISQSRDTREHCERFDCNHLCHYHEGCSRQIMGGTFPASHGKTRARWLEPNSSGWFATYSRILVAGLPMIASKSWVSRSYRLPTTSPPTPPIRPAAPVTRIDNCDDMDAGPFPAIRVLPGFGTSVVRFRNSDTVGRPFRA